MQGTIVIECRRPDSARYFRIAVDVGRIRDFAESPGFNAPDVLGYLNVRQRLTIAERVLLYSLQSLWERNALQVLTSAESPFADRGNTIGDYDRTQGDTAVKCKGTNGFDIARKRD